MRCLSDEALEFVRAGATAITPGPWFSQAIMRQFVERQAADGHGTWNRPRILGLHAWLLSLWKERRYSDPTTPALLSSQQETFLWHQIIERDSFSDVTPLLEVGATARQARAAALACAEYEIPLTDPRWRQDHDPTQFAAWLKQFNQLCARESWMTLGTWWGQVSEWIATTSREGQQLLLAGFDSVPPALERLLNAWCSAGAQIRRAERVSGETFIARMQLTTPESEWESAARWARSQLERNSSSIGVVVPDLGSNHALVQRIFDDVFSPGHLAHEVSPSASQAEGVTEPVHVAFTAPLRDHPLVASALLLLETVSERIPMASASALLRSPYLGGAAAERMLRAQADIQMRRSRELEVSLTALARVTKRAPQARLLFSDLQTFLKRRPESADFAYWARFIADLLKLAGWPGETDLTASERAIVEEWKHGLSSLSSLGLVSTTVKWPMALSQLRRVLAAEQPHRGDASSPVQVLDIRSAASLRFDQVWVTGLSPAQWNPRIDSFPLIPRAMQVEAKMPSATQAWQRQRERETIHSLVRGGLNVIASHIDQPLPILDSLIKSPPPGLVVLEDANSATSGWAGPLWHRSFLPSDMEQVADSEAPHARNAKPAGGTRIIKYQSECPFRAFAEIRLSATKPVEGTFGFDALERGQFLHHVLEFVWRRLRTQERLKAMPASGLEALVAEGIAAATANVDDESEFQRELTEVERLRLGSLVLDWLDVEKQRLVPFAVEDVEQGQTFEMEGVTIKLRIDRIDRLNNGKLLLVDYKSGAQAFEKLEGERPEEPQLLVYSAAMGDAVEGLLFGQVRRGDLKLVGISKDQHVNGRKLKVLGSGWASQQRRWNDTVKQLARSFRQGEATVDPTAKACAFCEVKPLCRIQEIRADQAVGGEDEGDE